VLVAVLGVTGCVRSTLNVAVLGLGVTWCAGCCTGSDWVCL